MDENMNLKRSIGTSKESKPLKQVDLIYVGKKKKNHFSCCVKSGSQQGAGSVGIAGGEWEQLGLELGCDKGDLRDCLLYF